MKIELDLMVDLDQPRVMVRWCDNIIHVNPDRVVFHLGSTYRWDELFTCLRLHKKQNNTYYGLAIRFDHSRREIRKILDNHDEFSFIQIMGIKKVGHSGEKLSPEIYDYIKKIKRSFPDYPIQIDGGVKVKHVAELLTAGADRLGMNSGLFKTKSIKKTLQSIKN